MNPLSSSSPRVPNSVNENPIMQQQNFSWQGAIQFLFSSLTTNISSMIPFSQSKQTPVMLIKFEKEQKEVEGKFESAPTFLGGVGQMFMNSAISMVGKAQELLQNVINIRSQVFHNAVFSSLSDHYKITDVSGDGDCFFHALGAILNPNESNRNNVMLEMRSVIAQYMEDNRGFYESQVDGDYDVHIKNLKESSFLKWSGAGQGEFIHAQVLAEITQRPVFIYTPIDLALGNEKDENGRPLPSDNYIFNTSAEGKPIRLVYNGINHWCYLEPLPSQEL